MLPRRKRRLACSTIAHLTISKLVLSRGAVEAGEIAWMGVILGASLFTAAYLLPVVRAAWFEAPRAQGGEAVETEAAGEARATIVVPRLATAALVDLLGLVPAAPGLQIGLAEDVARQVFGGSP